ncbi:MAG: hypothetical protein ACXVQY_10325 [Actinomycetota bacterium]
MKVLTRRHGDAVTLVAPGTGRVRFHAPETLCGELEIFDAHEIVADIDGVLVVAPGHGFVVRQLVPDYSLAAAGTGICEFRIA